MKFNSGKELWTYMERHRDDIAAAIPDPDYDYFIDSAISVQCHEDEIANLKKVGNWQSNAVCRGMIYQVKGWRDESLKVCNDLLNKYSV